jgi:hypothetical protein
MPTAKIHVHGNQYDERRLARLGDAIQGALEAVLKTPPGWLLPRRPCSDARFFRAHPVFFSAFITATISSCWRLRSSRVARRRPGSHS